MYTPVYSYRFCNQSKKSMLTYFLSSLSISFLMAIGVILSFFRFGNFIKSLIKLLGDFYDSEFSFILIPT